jgi:hypothetical protein
MRRCKLFNCDIKLRHKAYNPRPVKHRGAAVFPARMTFVDNPFPVLFPEAPAREKKIQSPESGLGRAREFRIAIEVLRIVVARRIPG